ncbi:MAG TPA: NDP-sugar synthase, partial [Thermoanaerobaculia bacterium]|nr:NDP-sugar synthase [Thermoanaerobaculia bacterium]
FDCADLVISPGFTHVVSSAHGAASDRKYDQRIGEARPIAELVAAAAPAGFDLRLHQIAGIGDQVPLVRHVLDRAAEAVLVIYGDSLLSLDFAALLRFHEAVRERGAKVTIVSHRPHDLFRAESDDRTYHGILAIDGERRLTRFEEKPKRTEITELFHLANAAVFVCERPLFDEPQFRDAKNFSYDVFEPAVLLPQMPLYAFDISSGFRMDLGNTERFFDANLKLLRGELLGPLPGQERSAGVRIGDGTIHDGASFTPPVLVGNGVRIERDAHIGPGAVIADHCHIGARAAVRNAVLLEGCHVGAAAVVDTCVLGPHVRIGAGVTLPAHSVLGAFSVAAGEDWPNWTEELR